MLINAIDPEESRIAVVSDGVLQELHVELASREAYLGNIYKGKVVNIEPSIGAAFVNFGGKTNGFLHASDVLPAYGRPDFQLEDILEGRARVSGQEGPESMRSALDDDDDEEAPPAGGADAPAAPAQEASAGNPDAQDAEGAGAEADPDADDREPRGDRGDEGPDRGDHAPETEDFGSDAGLGADEGPEAGDRQEAQEGPERNPAYGSAAAHPQAEGEGDAPGTATTAAPVSVEPAPGPRGRERRGRRGRGRSPREREPRVRVPIDQLLKKGQEVIVQITKEGIGMKGPTLTTYVSLPGRCLVVMPSLPKCGVSRKIEDDRERKRLKKIVRELDETGRGGIGFIVRTAGVNKTLQDLERDRDYLKKIWEVVGQRAKVTRAPAMLYEESDLVLKAMRDLFSPDIEEVVVDSQDVHLRIRDFAEKLMPRMAERIKIHELSSPLFHAFGIEKEVESLFQPRVELPNGGSIVIDQTEALVAIDVNSGRFKPGSDLEETAYRTNLEAIPEIVRQLRLRDLGGVIICDFIDMSAEKHRRAIERMLIDELRGDRARIKVGKISPFGILEITRQRVGPGLKRAMFQPCAHCRGSGLTRTITSKALTILREVRALISLKGFSILQIYACPQVADYLANFKRRPVMDLEEAAGKTIMFKAEPTYPIDVVHYRFLTGDGQEARVNIPAGLGVKA